MIQLLTRNSDFSVKDVHELAIYLLGLYQCWVWKDPAQNFPPKHLNQTSQKKMKVDFVHRLMGI